MQETTEKLIWKSKSNKFYRHNSYIYFGLAVILIILPFLIFPFSVILEWRWGLAFYIIFYSIIIPLSIYLILLGINFTQKHISIIQNGLKIKRGALNPKKKFIRFKDIENIDLKKIEPTNYHSIISKRLLYDLDKNPKLMETGDYTSLVIKTKNGTFYNIKGSYLSEINKTKELIERTKRELTAIKPKEIKKIPVESKKKSIKKEKSVKEIGIKVKPKIKAPKGKVKPVVKTIKKEKEITAKVVPEINLQPSDDIPSEKVEPKILPTYFCKNCGTKISGSGIFCVKCGKKVE